MLNNHYQVNTTLTTNKGTNMTFLREEAFELAAKINELDASIEDYTEFSCCSSQACDCYEYMTTDRRELVNQLSNIGAQLIDGELYPTQTTERA